MHDFGLLSRKNDLNFNMWPNLSVPQIMDFLSIRCKNIYTDDDKEKKVLPLL